MRYRLLIVLITLIWGSSFVMVKSVTDYIAPSWILVMRFAVASLLLALAFAPRHHAFYLEKSHVRSGLILGVILFFAYYLQTVGITDTTPGKNAFLTATYCVIAPFTTWIFMKIRPNRFNVIAAVMCIVGIGLISLDGFSGMRFGDAMTLGCAVFYALQITFTAKYVKDRDVYAITIWQFATVAVLAAVVGVVSDPVPNLAALPTDVWWQMAYLAVVVTALALMLQNVAQAHVPPSSAGILLSLESVFGAAFSIALGQEDLTARIVAGFVLVFASVLVSEALPGRK